MAEMLEGSGSRKLDVGDVVATTFGTWAKNFVPFTLLALVVYSPLLLLSLVIRGAAEAGGGLGIVLSIGLVFFALGVLLGQVLTGALTFGVVQSLRGKPVTLSDSLKVGLARMFPALGTGIVVGVLIAIGMVLLCVPGLILMCVLAAAVPAAVIEKPGVMGALKRSAALTEGSRWQIFVLFLIVFALSWLYGRFVGPSIIGIGGPVAVLLHFAVTNLVIQVINGVGSAVVYYQLRTKKEGASAEDIAKVFE